MRLWKKFLESKYDSWRSLTKGNESLFESRRWKDLRSISAEEESGK